MLAEIDRYRDDMSARYAEELRAHQDRMRAIDEDHKARMARIVTGAADEPAPTDPQQSQVGAFTAGRYAPASGGPGPAGQPDPHAAEADLAREIASMPLDEYAKRRAELGVRSPTDMSRLFREQ
jgi:hypothetical protein